MRCNNICRSNRELRGLDEKNDEVIILYFSLEYGERIEEGFFKQTNSVFGSIKYERGEMIWEGNDKNYLDVIICVGYILP